MMALKQGPYHRARAARTSTWCGQKTKTASKLMPNHGLAAVGLGNWVGTERAAKRRNSDFLVTGARRVAEWSGLGEELAVSGIRRRGDCGNSPGRRAARGSLISPIVWPTSAVGSMNLFSKPR